MRNIFIEGKIKVVFFTKTFNNDIVNGKLLKLLVTRYVIVKGQLISKGLFGILNSTNEKFQLNYYTSLTCFRSFMEEFEDNKNTFRN